jgi:hypothetical protein
MVTEEREERRTFPVCCLLLRPSVTFPVGTCLSDTGTNFRVCDNLAYFNMPPLQHLTSWPEEAKSNIKDICSFYVCAIVLW